jgi:hypothetical protein
MWLNQRHCERLRELRRQLGAHELDVATALQETLTILIEASRCTAELDRRRCVLAVGHGGPHIPE